MQLLTILIVEDEVFIRDFLKGSLEDGGYAVIEAASGEEAIAMIRDGGASFRGIITDINLGAGKPTGWDVARRGRESAPDLPIIYTTGDSADKWASMGVPNSMLVHKPYAPAQIIAAISQMLISGGPTPVAAA